MFTRCRGLLQAWGGSESPLASVGAPAPSQGPAASPCSSVLPGSGRKAKKDSFGWLESSLHFREEPVTERNCKDTSLILGMFLLSLQSYQTKYFAEP